MRTNKTDGLVPAGPRLQARRPPTLLRLSVLARESWNCTRSCSHGATVCNDLRPAHCQLLSACSHPMRTSQWPGPRWRGMLATHAQRAPCACMDLSRRCAWAGRARRQPLDRSPTRTICGTTAAKSRTCTRQVRQARQAQPWALLSMKQLVRPLLCEYLRLAWCSRCVHLQQQCQGDPPQSLHRPQAPAGTPSTECLASHGDAGAERTYAHHQSQFPSSPVK